MEPFVDTVWLYMYAACMEETALDAMQGRANVGVAGGNVDASVDVRRAEGENEGENGGQAMEALAIEASRTRIPRPRLYRNRRLLDGLAEEEVIKLYRLSSSAIYNLYEIVKEDLEPRAPTNRAVPGLAKLLGALHFLSSGTFQSTLALTAGFSQPTFSRILFQVLKALKKHTARFINFPQCASEWRELKADFYALAQMPHVLGVIDCTHIALTPPRTKEESFRNRKDFHSLNVQMVCDAKQRITNVFVGFPGSSHDSFVLQKSALSRKFEYRAFPYGWLLGDAGYGSRPWLLTPLSNPVSAAERRFQAAHIGTRGVIERTFGALKSRFRCLDRAGGALQYSPSRVCDIVIGCAILHNICIANSLEVDIDPEISLDLDLSTEVVETGELGNPLRQRVISEFFS